MPRVAVVALDGALAGGLGTILDVFELANRYVVGQYDAVDVVRLPSEVRVLSVDGKDCRLASGRIFAVEGAWSDSGGFDLIYVGGFLAADEGDLEARLLAASGLCEWLKLQHDAGALIAASGTANFFLAEAGLFDAQIATAPWWLERLFKRRYPHIALDIARVIVETGSVLCTGAIKGEGALALRLVERILSPNVANWLAKVTLIDPYPDGEEPWSVFSPRVLRQDSMVGRAQHWLQQRFSQKPKMGDLASYLRVSERTLERHFQTSLGMSPLDYLQLLRVEAAKQMLARSSRRVERVAYLVGYADTSYFKQVFRDQTGMTPSEYRRTARAQA